MTQQVGIPTLRRGPRGSSSRRRRRWPWILAGAVVLILVLIAAAIWAFVAQPAPAPLTLPRAAAAAPSGPANGTWSVAPGSVAGFRVPESALGISNDVVGRTSAVTGTMVISSGRVTSAQFRVTLAAIMVGGKSQPQLAKSLGTRQHPAAVFTLTRPATLSPAFASGAVITVRANGTLAMNGVVRSVTFTISGRRAGPELQVAGSVPVAFSGWNIKGPGGAGFLGSLADHGVAEFRLDLRRRTESAAVTGRQAALR
jgi:polyisoprenoid-binding protein YceI